MTERLDAIASGLSRVIREQGSEYTCGDEYCDDCEDCEGFLSAGSEQRLLEIVQPRGNEGEDDYRRRVAAEIDVMVATVLQPCTAYLGVLNDDVKPVDHLIARKLYEAYKKRINDRIQPGDSYARRDWNQYWNQFDEPLLGGV